MDKQQIPAGYKQTEVGVIPEDWSVKNIGDALTIRHGRDQKEVETVDGKYPILATGGEIGRTNVFLYDKPSVLIGRKGTINKPRFIDSPFWTVDTLFYSEVAKKFEPKFLYYKFCLIDWMLYNEASGVPSLNASTIENVIQSFPSNIKEQTAIANALSDVDALIAALEKLIDKKTTIKTATMQQLLTGKKRLPPFDQLDVGYKQTELGEIPKDWKLTKLGQVCTLVNGRGFKPYEWSDNGLPIIRIQNLNGSEEFNYFNGHYDPKLFIEHNQLLFAWSGSRGTSFGPHVWRGGNALLNYHTWKMVVDSTGIESNYFYHALKELTKMIEDSAHGASALVHTQKGEMEKLEFPIPRIREEQIAIANVLSDMDTELDALQQRLAKTQHIKQGMMQELLTGKTRLVTV